MCLRTIINLTDNGMSLYWNSCAFIYTDCDEITLIVTTFKLPLPMKWNRYNYINTIAEIVFFKFFLHYFSNSYTSMWIIKLLQLIYYMSRFHRIIEEE